MVIPIMPARGAAHSTLPHYDRPMGITPAGLGNNPLYGSGGLDMSSVTDPGVSAAIDYHQQDMQKFAQSVSDTNVFWGMFNAETTTKASIVGVLTKLEDKYQVRG
jgi:hypothetical protein